MYPRVTGIERDFVMQMLSADIDGDRRTTPIEAIVAMCNDVNDIVGISEEHWIIDRGLRNCVVSYELGWGVKEIFVKLLDFVGRFEMRKRVVYV